MSPESARTIWDYLVNAEALMTGVLAQMEYNRDRTAGDMEVRKRVGGSLLELHRLRNEWHYWFSEEIGEYVVISEVLEELPF